MVHGTESASTTEGDQSERYPVATLKGVSDDRVHGPEPIGTERLTFTLNRSNRRQDRVVRLDGEGRDPERRPGRRRDDGRALRLCEPNEDRRAPLPGGDAAGLDDGGAETGRPNPRLTGRHGRRSPMMASTIADDKAPMTITAVDTLVLLVIGEMSSGSASVRRRPLARLAIHAAGLLGYGADHL